MLKVGLLSSFLFFIASINAFSQNVNSVQDGPWNLGSTWSGGVVPDAGNSDIIIIDHNVYIPNGYSVTIDGTTVNSGATLTVNSGGTLDVALAVFDALDVQGDLIANNGSTITNTDGDNVIFNSGSVYHHQFITTEGVIPLATWDSNSTLQIEGYTNFSTATVGGNWDQEFGIVVWDCQAQTATCNLSGLLVSIASDFTVSSTNSGTLELCTSEAPNIVIGGNFTIDGTSKVIISTTGVGTVVDIGGDFVYTSTNSTGTQTNSTGQCTLNVAGSFYMDAPGGNLYFERSGSNGIGTMNLSGDFTLLNGTITESGSTAARGVFNFIGSGTQQFLNTGTITNTFYYYIASSSILDVIDESPLRSSSGGVLTVDGTIRVASTNISGAIVTGISAGNIRLGTRTFNPGSTIVYSGSSDQIVGNGHPSSSGVNMEVANPSGVTVNNATGGSGLTNLNIGGNLILTSGNLTIDSSPGTSARTLTINGNITANGNTISFIGATSNKNDLVINGSGALGTFPFSSGAQILRNLTVNRTSGSITFNRDMTVGALIGSNGNILFNGATTTITSTATLSGSGTVDFNGTGTVSSTLSMASGTILYFEGQSLTLSGAFTGSGLLSSNSTSTLTLNGGVQYGTLAFAPTGNSVGTLNLNRASGTNPRYILSSSLTVVSALNILNGQFNNISGLSMGSGAVLTRNNAGSLTSSIPGGGPYNVVYTGTSLTTGLEAQGSLSNMTINVSNTVTGGSSLSMTGSFIIMAGIFSATGSPTISAGSFTNNGTYRGQTTNFTVTGDLTNNGTFNANTSTFTFNGNSNILGSSAPIFNNIVVSGILNSPANLSLAGNFTNNGTFNASTGTVTFSGSAAQSIQGGVAATFNNITVTNTANPSVRVESNQNLRGILTLSSSSNFDADGSGNTSIFTLLSTGDNPTLDAAIAILPSNAFVTGNVTVQRFMSIEGASGGNIYRYISSPVQNAPVSDIQNEIPVTGTFTGNNNLTCTGCSAGSTQSMFSYNESVIGGVDAGYLNFPSATNTETFQPGVGYTIYVRGKTLGTALWDLRGPINQGNVVPVTLPVSFTSSGSLADDGWNLVGNPFASTIDWNASSGWTKAGLDGSIYIRDNGRNTPVYATWNGVTGTNGGSRYISTGQGFWVKATSTPTLTLDENVKAAGTPTAFIRTSTLENILRVTMKNAVDRDETVIHFRDDATSGFDSYADAWKLPNATFNLSSIQNDGRKLSINSQPVLDCSSTIKLDVTSSAGTYAFEFSQFDSFLQNVSINLVDNYLNKIIDVRNAQSYSFQVSSDLKSFGSDRFKIVFSTPQLLPFTTTSSPICENSNASISISNSQSGVSYVATSNQGEIISSSIIGNGGLITLPLNPTSLTNGMNPLQIKSSVNGCSASVEQPVDLEVIALEKVNSVENAKSCKAGSVIVKASGASSASHYNWYTEANSISPITGQTLASFVTPLLSSTATYFVSITNGIGCESERRPVVAKVVEFNDAKIVEMDGNILMSNFTDGNQWYFNGEKISGATNQSLAAKKSGSYKVEVITDGCSTIDEQEFLVTGRENDLRASVRIYPNPTDSDLYVEIPESVKVRFVKMFSNLGVDLGTVLLLDHNGSKIGKFDMSSLPTGMYIVKVYGEGELLNVKVSKK